MKTSISSAYPANRQPFRPSQVGRFPSESKSRLLRHRVYDALLKHLSNPRIRSTKTGQILPYILHPNTKSALRSECGYSSEDIARVEAGIFADVERGLSGFEAVRDVPPVLYGELKRQGISDLIFNKNIVPIPGAVLNALICEAMQKQFSRYELLACPGFVEISELDGDGNKLTAMRLDIENHLARAGFMMPVVRFGFISALKVFRHPKDERPFYLKSRKEGRI
jgi:hypothetical protein